MKKSMQIHFWGHVNNTSGSVEKLVLTFARHQKRYIPIIACKGERNAREKMGKLAVRTFAESRFKNRLLNKLLGLHAFTFDSLVPIIREERPDILHVHNRQELVDRLVARLDYRPAVVVHYHRNFAQPCIPETANLLLTVSSATRHHIMDLTGTRKPFEVLHNPLSDALLQYSPISPNNPHPVILYGGGSAERKGFPELMAATHRLKGDCTIKICGPGLDHFVTEQKNIEVLGLVPYTKFMHEMQQADIVVMPSHKEPFALTALEALYFGKVLVASNDGGFSEMLAQEYAILTKPGDVDSLTCGLQDALDMVKNSSSNLRQLRLEAQRVSNLYRPQNVINKLEDYYSLAEQLSA